MLVTLVSGGKEITQPYFKDNHRATYFLLFKSTSVTHLVSFTKPYRNTNLILIYCKNH